MWKLSWGAVGELLASSEPNYVALLNGEIHVQARSFPQRLNYNRQGRILCTTLIMQLLSVEKKKAVSI